MAKFEEPPVVPLENTNDVVHRRQLAMRANAAPVSGNGVGRLLYPKTSAETSASVTPVNYRYPEGHVLRYGTNTTPGTTDMSAAIQAAVDVGKDVFIPDGTYRVDTEISVKSSHVRFWMGRNAVIDISNMDDATTLEGVCAFRVEGEEGSSITVSGTIAVGDTQLTVDSTSTFEAGDYVSIRSSDLYMDGVSGSPANRGHTSRIRSIDSSTTLTLVDGSPFAYTTGIGIRKYTMLEGVEFHGGKILGGGVGAAHSGILAYYTVDLLIRGVVIQDTESYGVRVAHSWNASIEHCDISGCTSPDFSNSGYGVAMMDGTRNSRVYRNLLRNNRTGVDGGNEPPAIFITVAGNVSLNPDDSSIGSGVACHEPSFWWTFRDNYCEGFPTGIKIRGQQCTVVNNVVNNAAEAGILVQSFDTNTDGITGTQILGNKVLNSGAAIKINGKDGELIHDTLLQGNVVKGAAIAALYATFFDGLTVNGDDYSDCTFEAVFIDGDSTPANGDNANLRIKANVHNAGSHGVYIEATDGVKCELEVHNIGTRLNNRSPLRCLLCRDVEVNGGTLSAEVSTNRFGISLERCDRVRVIGTSIVGNDTLSTQSGIRMFNDSGSTSTGLQVVGCHIRDCQLHAVHTSDTDEVIVTSSNIADVGSATKVNNEDATTWVTANNID